MTVKSITNKFDQENSFKKAKRRPQLQEVLSYQNDALVSRFKKDFHLTKQEAEQLFDDVKRFLWLGAIVDKPIAPPPKVDDGWHTFIIFTEDYAEFCEKFFGCFRHHRPTRPGDPPDNGETIRQTIFLFEEYFGELKNLSENWHYPHLTGGLTCFATCTTPSTNCQTPPCS